jgi:hypothetical protein
VPIDIAKLAQQYMTSHADMDSVRSVAARIADEEREHLHRLLNPMPDVQSLMGRHLEDERRLLDHCRDQFSSAAQLTIDRFLQHDSEIDRVAKLFELPKATLDVLDPSARIADELARFANPLRDVVDRIVAEQRLDAPWLTQMGSAAQLAREFIDSWAERSGFDDDGVNWAALDQHLEDVQVAIQQLPLEDTTDRQLRATGITRVEWVTLAFALLGLLLQLLDYMESLEQGQFSRQQAAEEQASVDRDRAEERKFRERLISTIEALAEHTPTRRAIYVVGARPVRIKSAISGGIYLGIAHPNQIVTVTGRRGRWIKIRFRDSIEERDVEGWVLKHYLIRRQANTDD